MIFILTLFQVLYTLLKNQLSTTSEVFFKRFLTVFRGFFRGFYECLMQVYKGFLYECHILESSSHLTEQSSNQTELY
jgi:hypothetical protein